jgi:hypothetical protein
MVIYQWVICKDMRFIFDEPHFYLIFSELNSLSSKKDSPKINLITSLFKNVFLIRSSVVSFFVKSFCFFILSKKSTFTNWLHGNYFGEFEVVIVLTCFSNIS